PARRACADASSAGATPALVPESAPPDQPGRRDAAAARSTALAACTFVRRLLLLAVLAPALAACALNPPRIVSISPGRDVADVPSNQTISIGFDRPMNHETVERRFDLAPALPGCNGSKDCRFAWSGNTLLFIHTHVNFALTTQYTVSMHAGYADASGQQNTLDHSWRFKTEGPP